MSALEYISLQTEKAVMTSEANIICLGNFDGVHMAHRALLKEAKRLQKERIPTASCGVFCFRQPSSDFLFDPPPRHLCTLEQKLARFAEEGMDFAILADFQALQGVSPEDFVTDVLQSQCGCVAAVCGYNYRFGKRGAGTPELLSSLLPGLVSVQPEIRFNGSPVSSTRIRSLLMQGDIEEANRLLTLPYSITAEVVHGKKLGRRLGTPTLNQSIPTDMQIPRAGVYVTDVIIDGKCYRGVTNIGTHPTVDAAAPLNCETYLLDFCGDLYGKTATVHFLHFIRPEQRFDSVEQLRLQIEADVAVAKSFPIY